MANSRQLRTKQEFIRSFRAALVATFNNSNDIGNIWDNNRKLRPYFYACEENVVERFENIKALLQCKTSIDIIKEIIKEMPLRQFISDFTPEQHTEILNNARTNGNDRDCAKNLKTYIDAMNIETLKKCFPNINKKKKIIIDLIKKRIPVHEMKQIEEKPQTDEIICKNGADIWVEQFRYELKINTRRATELWITATPEFRDYFSGRKIIFNDEEIQISIENALSNFLLAFIIPRNGIICAIWAKNDQAFAQHIMSLSVDDQINILKCLFEKIGQVACKREFLHPFFSAYIRSIKNIEVLKYCLEEINKFTSNEEIKIFLTNKIESFDRAEDSMTVSPEAWSAELNKLIQTNSKTVTELWESRPELQDYFSGIAVTLNGIKYQISPEESCHHFEIALKSDIILRVLWHKNESALIPYISRLSIPEKAIILDKFMKLMHSDCILINQYQQTISDEVRDYYFTHLKNPQVLYEEPTVNSKPRNVYTEYTQSIEAIYNESKSHPKSDSSSQIARPTKKTKSSEKTTPLNWNILPEPLPDTNHADSVPPSTPEEKNSKILNDSGEILFPGLSHFGFFNPDISSLSFESGSQLSDPEAISTVSIWTTPQVVETWEEWEALEQPSKRPKNS